VAFTFPERAAAELRTASSIESTDDLVVLDGL
jgi:hypothetical protein